MIASLQLITCITIILGSEQNINHYIISLYKSLSTDTFLLTNDLVEASLWASTVEVTLHTSGAPLLFSFPIVWQKGRTFSRGKQARLFDGVHLRTLLQCSWRRAETATGLYGCRYSGGPLSTLALAGDLVVPLACVLEQTALKLAIGRRTTERLSLRRH